MTAPKLENGDPEFDSSDYPWHGRLMEFASRRAYEITELAKHFGYKHLPEGFLREISWSFCKQAVYLVDVLPDDPQLVIAIQRLLESKDAAVRTARASIGRRGHRAHPRDRRGRRSRGRPIVLGGGT